MQLIILLISTFALAELAIEKYSLNFTLPENILESNSTKILPGNVEILFYSKVPQNLLFLNSSKNIQISSVNISKNSIKWKRRGSILEILVSGGLVPFLKTTLLISFDTEIAKVSDEKLVHRDLVGIFEENVIGSDSVSIATYLEPNHASRFFPCFDRKITKSVFELSVKNSSKDTTVLFNTEAKEEEDDFVIFYPTPRMPLHLLSFVILNSSDFSYQSSSTKRISVLSSKRNIDSLHISIFEEALDFFESVFEMPHAWAAHSLRCLVLDEFSAAAVESPGLMIFRADQILLDRNSSLLDYVRALITIGHEMAHQWFGNTVSIGQWSDLWLNEGFATFFSYEFLKKYIDDDIVSDLRWTKSFVQALQNDRKSATHPLSFAPEDPRALFDKITYYKSSSILYEYRDIIMEKLPAYLSMFYSSAVSTDAFLRLMELPEEYFYDKGLPNIELQISSSGIVIEKTTAIFKMLPVCYRTKDGQEENIFLKEGEQLFMPENSLFPNCNGRSFYTVSFDKQLNSDILSDIDDLNEHELSYLILMLSFGKNLEGLIDISDAVLNRRRWVSTNALIYAYEQLFAKNGIPFAIRAFLEDLIDPMLESLCRQKGSDFNGILLLSVYLKLYRREMLCTSSAFSSLIAEKNITKYDPVRSDCHLWNHPTERWKLEYLKSEDRIWCAQKMKSNEMWHHDNAYIFEKLLAGRDFDY